jgi:AcrR family transcriptional regulator
MIEGVLPLSPSAAPPPVQRRRGRPGGNTAHAVDERAVLDLAFDAFAERGYEGTTVRELAKVLGVSHNLLNVRFGSKAELWRRAVDARVARIAPPVFAAFDAPGVNDEERLRLLVRNFCRWASQNSSFVGLANVEGRRGTWRNDYLVDAYIMPFKRRLDALLARVAARRRIGTISSSALTAFLVQGVGFYFAAGPLLDRLGTGEEIAPEHIERQVSALSEFILAGLLPAD